MIEIGRIEVRGFDNLPPALKDTISKRWMCSCAGDEYDKIIVKDVAVSVFYVCRMCGLLKKIFENIRDTEVV